MTTTVPDDFKSGITISEEYTLRRLPELPQNISSSHETKSKINWNKKVVSEVLKSFVTDGFFLYYTAQKIKILVIGKESVGISGADYPDLI